MIYLRSRLTFSSRHSWSYTPLRLFLQVSHPSFFVLSISCLIDLKFFRKFPLLSLNFRIAGAIFSISLSSFSNPSSHLSTWLSKNCLSLSSSEYFLYQILSWVLSMKAFALVNKIFLRKIRLTFPAGASALNSCSMKSSVRLIIRFLFLLIFSLMTIPAFEFI